MRNSYFYLILVAASVLMFQNCGGLPPESTKPINQSSGTGSSSGGSSSGGFGSSSSSSSGGLGGSSSSSSSGSSSGSSSSSSSSSGAGSTGLNCEAAFADLGWFNPSEPLRVSLSGSVSSYEVKAAGRFVRDRFLVSFEGPVSPNMPSGASTARYYFAAGSGLSLRFKNSVSGAVVATVGEADFVTNTSVVRTEQIGITSANTQNTKNTRLTLTVPRRFFDQTRSSSSVYVEVVCHGTLVNRAIQDLRAMDYDLLAEHLQSPNGSIYVNVAGVQHLTVEVPPTGIARTPNLDCPTRVAAGAPATCTLRGAYANLSWTVNGTDIGGNNVNPITTPNS